MLRFLGRCLVLGLLGVVLTGSPAAAQVPPQPTAEATPPTTAAPTTPAPGCAAAEAAARGLVAQGRLDEAEALYKAVAGPNPDRCIGAGLAEVATSRAAKAEDDKKKVEDDDVTVAEIGTSWEGVLKEYVTPLQGPVLAGLAVLAVLLLAARLLTPVAVGPTDVSWSARRRTAVWSSGVAVLAVATALGVAAVSWPIASEKVSLAAGLLLGVVLLAVLYWWMIDPRATRTPLIGLAIGVVLVVVSLALTGDPAVVVAALAAAVPAVCLVSAARGHAARLVVEVRGTGGATDDAAGRYVVNVLQRLGTRQPGGLRIPEPTDVTDLPPDALASVPGEAVAKAFFALLQVLRLSTPWYAVVSFPDTTTMTVQLQRNGRTSDRAATTLTLAAVDPSGSVTADTSEAGKEACRRRLLVGAAAHILLELAECHRELKQGLGNVCSSLSLALHTIASTKSPRLTVAERDALIIAAAHDDPGNLLAQCAANGLLGRRATFEDQKCCAEATERLLTRVDQSEDVGLATLRLRLRFTLAAAWINAFLLARTDDKYDAKRAAGKAVDRLHEALGEAALLAGDTQDLVTEIRQCALLLTEGLSRSSRRGINPLPVEGAVRPGVAYCRACCRAADRSLQTAEADTAKDAEIDEILDDLDTALTDARNREWARIDPSLSWLRRSRHAERFVGLVGDAPPASILELPLLSEHREPLRKLGIRDPQDLLDAPSSLIRTATGAAPHVVRRWKDVAALALQISSEAPEMRIGLLTVVVECGVMSRAQLRARVEDWARWQPTVREAMTSLAVAEPTEEEWRRHAGLLPVVAVRAR